MLLNHNFLVLAKLLDAASTVLPLVVGVSGRIGADTTISCALSGLQAVILNITVHKLINLTQN